VVVLDADGFGDYATYLGGDGGGDAGWGIDIAGDDAIVTGYAAAVVDVGFPGLTGQSNCAFVSRLDDEGGLAWSKCLGVNTTDPGWIGVAVSMNDFSNISVVGRTGRDFLGKTDAFAASFSGDGSLTHYSIVLGGLRDNDWATGVFRTLDDDTYVTGVTESSGFPTTNGVLSRTLGSSSACPFEPCSDAFVTKLDFGGGIVWSTYLGGEHNDSGLGIVVDAGGSPIVVGTTHSEDFPVENAFQSTIGGQGDAFVAKLEPDGSALSFSTYLGGSGHEDWQFFFPGTMGIALSGQLDLVFGSITTSANFPSASGFDQDLSGSSDGFVAAISFLDCRDTTGDGNEDTDGDGLCDNWESEGIDLTGNGTIDLPLHEFPFSADPMRKDVFVEIDYMFGGDHNHMPTPGVLLDVFRAFSDSPVPNPNLQTQTERPGVNLHFFLDDPLFELTPLRFGHLDGPDNDFLDVKLGNNREPCESPSGGGGAFGTAADRAARNCRSRIAARRLVFHYALFGHEFTHPVRGGGTGIAEVRGNDLMVAIGWVPRETLEAAGASQDLYKARRRVEAGTLMHELGHNLGLTHGGSDAINCKPNYMSVMNATRTFLDFDPTRPLDFSAEALPELDEGALDEPEGVQGPANLNAIFGTDGAYDVVRSDLPIDWNNDGDAVDLDVISDVNVVTGTGCKLEVDTDGDGEGDAPLFSFLTSYDDWANLVYPFREEPSFGDSGSMIVPQTPERQGADILAAAQLGDFDGDGVTNHPDNCPAIANATQDNSDGDETGDACDTCAGLANPDQIDSDGDGYGNACDPDYDGSGSVDRADFELFRTHFDSHLGDPAYDPDFDADGDGAIGIPDYNVFRLYFGGPPGPSGLACAGSAPCPASAARVAARAEARAAANASQSEDEGQTTPTLATPTIAIQVTPAAQAVFEARLTTVLGDDTRASETPPPDEAEAWLSLATGLAAHLVRRVDETLEPLARRRRASDEAVAAAAAALSGPRGALARLEAEDGAGSLPALVGALTHLEQARASGLAADDVRAQEDDLGLATYLVAEAVVAGAPPSRPAAARLAEGRDALRDGAALAAAQAFHRAARLVLELPELPRAAR
jgi:hypothetical protein